MKKELQDKLFEKYPKLFRQKVFQFCLIPSEAIQRHFIPRTGFDVDNSKPNAQAHQHQKLVMS